MKVWTICIMTMLFALATVSAFAAEDEYPVPALELFNDEQSNTIRITLDHDRYLRYQAIRGTLNWTEEAFTWFKIEIRGYSDMGYEGIASRIIHCDSGQSEAQFIFTGAEIDDLFTKGFYSGEVSVTVYAPDSSTGEWFQNFGLLNAPIGAPVLHLILPEAIFPDDESSVIIPYWMDPGSYPFQFTTVFTAYDAFRVSLGSETVRITDAGYNGVFRIPDAIMEMNSTYIGISIDGFQDAIFQNGAVETEISELIPVSDGHAWLQPVYTWAEDQKSVTAVRVCDHNADHRQTETVSVTRAISLAPTENETGAFMLTSAEFKNPAFSRQEKTELIPAIRDLHVLSLPAALTTIESEAFTHLGNIDAVRVPHSVRIIADDAFDQGILLIVPAGSYAETWAEGREDIYSFNQTE